ncbi:unnamed protein product [Hymenolepis diminuta]|uniref:DUF4105 domain-containing protein n=1 Tax=Hymenolepis diminuta TaxID=6216 RepID=A0A0R3SP32_HYMDI|nr:unnamed protein product [Hymenolepis diminuta]
MQGGNRLFFRCCISASIVCFLFILGRWTAYDLSTTCPSFFNATFDRYPYSHVLNQIQWISANSRDKSNLSLGSPVKIYYDRHIIYHVTKSEGCRLNCIYTKNIGYLNKGDIAVFSGALSRNIGKKLKRRGVWIAFETAESPVHMRRLPHAQANLVDIFITYMPWSEIPCVYPLFIRNENPGYAFTREEVNEMLARNNTYLLPKYHYNRTKLIAWVVSNGRPRNNRKEFAYSLRTFVPVS